MGNAIVLAVSSVAMPRLSRKVQDLSVFLCELKRITSTFLPCAFFRVRFTDSSKLGNSFASTLRLISS
jgi:hypothetical protein